MSALPHSDTANEERLKAALWYSIGKTVDAVALHGHTNASPQFIGALTEMVHAKIASISTDLEAFGKHGGRSTINTKDVILLARNNEGLQNLLIDKARDVRQRDANT